MLVLCSLLDSSWKAFPEVDAEEHRVHFLRPALQTIWLHHASGASPAGLVFMHVAGKPDAAFLRGLELRLPLVGTDLIS